jgi:hypothetical protein
MEFRSLRAANGSGPMTGFATKPSRPGDIRQATFVGGIERDFMG